MILYFSLGDPEWIKQAACRQPAATDADLFFSPDDTEGTPTGPELGRMRSEQAERDLLAKARYCSLCPSRGRCATEGWREEFGTWGGWSPAERRQMDRGDYRPPQVRVAVSKRRDEALRLVRSGLSIEDTAIKMEVGLDVVAGYLRAHWALVTQSEIVTESS